MCCFSRAVRSVSETRIFAREGEGAEQHLVYRMKLRASEELAMILPLPVAPGTSEIRFISLEGYPGFFDDLLAGFPAAAAAARLREAPTETMGILGLVRLPVVPVGAYEASFVPTAADFRRLDPRFRLPPRALDRLPEQRGYGFAVFKLRQTPTPGQSPWRADPTALEFHPMALSFPRARPDRLFFPTVHIHDGKVRQEAEFDHALYAQPRDLSRAARWSESPRLASSFMKLDQAKGLIDGGAHVYRLALQGTLPNRDTWL